MEVVKAKYGEAIGALEPLKVKRPPSPSPPLPLPLPLLLRLLLRLPLQPLLLLLKLPLKHVWTCSNLLALRKRLTDPIKAHSYPKPHKSKNGSSTPSSLLPEKRSKHDPKISV